MQNNATLFLNNHSNNNNSKKEALLQTEWKSIQNLMNERIMAIKRKYRGYLDKKRSIHTFFYMAFVVVWYLKKKKKYLKRNKKTTLFLSEASTISEWHSVSFSISCSFLSHTQRLCERERDRKRQIEEKPIENRVQGYWRKHEWKKVREKKVEKCFFFWRMLVHHVSYNIYKCQTSPLKRLVLRPN